MQNNLGIVICENFIKEIELIVENNAIENIIVSSYDCNNVNTKSKQNDYILNAIEKCEDKCNRIIIIIDNTCYVNLEKFICNKNKYIIYKLENSFDLLINKDIISHFLHNNLYLVTPGYLKNWKNDIGCLNSIRKNKMIRLLDTGIYDESYNELKEFAEYIRLPYDSYFVGLDYLSMFIEKNILEWKLKYTKIEKPCNLETSNFKGSFNKKEEQLLYILDTIYEGVFIMDSNYKILFVNKGVVKLLQLENFKSIVGKNVFDIGIIHNNYRETVLNRFKNVITNCISAPLIEEKLIQYNGNVITVNIYSEFIKYNDTPCILSVIRDISESKKSETLQLKIEEQNKLLNKAAEDDKLKTEFFANLSHEFRTPVNVMLSTLQLVNWLILNRSTVTTKEKDNIKKYYNIMKQNCFRLLRLVNNLIDITKIEADFFKLNLKNENIITIIEDITLSVADYAKNKGLSLIFDTDTEEKNMACDADKIERIILNLLSNSIKFTSSGGNIFVNITSTDSTIILSVKDNGTGIPPDKQTSIFKRFIQANKSLSKNKEGSGIGLSLVKSLVELHKGTIRLVSEYGKGSEFIIELPVTILPENKDVICDDDITKENHIQRINIEFSDIYD